MILVWSLLQWKNMYVTHVRAILFPNRNEKKQYDFFSPINEKTKIFFSIQYYRKDDWYSKQLGTLSPREKNWNWQSMHHFVREIFSPNWTSSGADEEKKIELFSKFELTRKFLHAAFSTTPKFRSSPELRFAWLKFRCRFDIAVQSADTAMLGICIIILKWKRINKCGASLNRCLRRI